MKIKGIKVNGGFVCKPQYKLDCEGNPAYKSVFYIKEDGQRNHFWEVVQCGKGYFSHWD